MPKIRFAVAIMTVPSLKIGRQLAKGILQKRLAACVNVLPGVESHYWWKGKLERSPELLLVIKTTRAKLRALERFAIEHHPYDTPEFMVLNVDSGNARYLAWLEDATA